MNNEFPAAGRQGGRIVAAFSLVAGFTLTTNIFGLVREVFLARTFGASGATDAFFSAFSIVSFFSLIFLAGPIQGSLLPRYLALNEGGNAARAASLLRYATIAALVAATIFSASLFATAGYLPALVFSGFSDTQVQISAEAIRWLSPIIVLSAIGAVVQAVLHSRRQFVWPAVVPLMTNIIVILAVIFLASRMGVQALSVGFLGGACIWLLVAFPVFRKAIGSAEKRCEEDTRRVLHAFLALAAMIVLDQTSAVVQRSLLSHYEQGLISALSYAARIAGLPIGILTAALAVVLFPRLVSEIASGRRDASRHFLQLGISTTVALLVPIAVFMAFDSKAIVSLILGGGKFDAAAVSSTSVILIVYAIGLPAQALLIFIEKAYLAAERARLVVAIGAVAGVMQVLFTVVAERMLGAIGVPLGTLVYAFFHLTLLLFFARRFIDMPWAPLGLGIAKICLAAAVAGLIYFVPMPDGLVTVFIRATIFACCYLALLYVLGERSLLLILSERS